MILVGIDLGGRTTGKTGLSFLDTDLNEIKNYSREYISERCGKSDKELIRFVESFRKHNSSDSAKTIIKV